MKSGSIEKYVWLVFVAIFLAMAFYHFIQSTKSINHIESQAKVKTINGMNLGVADFITDFNKYIDEYNSSTKRSNAASAVAHLIAAAWAFASFLFALSSKV